MIMAKTFLLRVIIVQYLNPLFYNFDDSSEIQASIIVTVRKFNPTAWKFIA